MKDQMTRIQEANGRLTGMSAADTAIGAARSTPAPLAVRSPLPPVPGLSTCPQFVAKVKAALGLDTKREAGIIASAVVRALEETLIDNIGHDGYSMKLGRFGKFSIRHRPGTYRKIPFTGETKMTSTKRKVKFVAIGQLRRLEKVRSAA